MKKLLVIILALVHLSASAGVTMHMHYCMGKAAGWGFTSKKDKTCDKCGMAKTNQKGKGCCKDEQKFVKNTIDQKADAVPVSVFQTPVINLSSVTEENPTSNAPPNRGLAVYLRNRVIRI